VRGDETMVGPRARGNKSIRACYQVRLLRLSIWDIFTIRSTLTSHFSVANCWLVGNSQVIPSLWNRPA